MRILYLSQYFPPEAGATQTRAFELARNWVRLGHAVTMLAEIPNHPSGIIPPAYRGKLYERVLLEGIDVIRLWVKASPIKTFRSRMLFYLSYMFSAALAGLLLAHGRYDLIYASSPPLFVGGAALALSKLRRIPLVFEVRDLWPESAVALGELSNLTAIRWASRLEEACYRRARRIVVVTQGIRERLLERGLPATKLVFAPNGANVEMFGFLPSERQAQRQEWGLEGKFIALYAGIHGVAQGLETLLEAARLLQDDPAYHFLLVGDGPRKAELAARAEQMRLPNLTLLPEQPRERMPAILSAADAALIPLRRLELFKGALPSKLFDAWACQRPVVLSVDGEARRALEACHGGIFAPPEDAPALAAALRSLNTDPAAASAMGKRGRAYTAAHYSRQACAVDLMNSLLELETNSGLP